MSGPDSRHRLDPDIGSGGAAAHLAIYGCQQNQADGDRLRGMLLAMGYTMTDDRAGADVLVLVTCAVRRHAETRLLGHLGTYMGKPGQKVVLCGCMAQREDVRELLRTRYKQVSLSFGPADLGRFPEYLKRLMTEGGRHIIASPGTAPIDEGLPVARIIDPELNRANVTIMTGCDNHCSYCVVPYVRGRERSRAPEAVLAEVRELAEGAGETSVESAGKKRTFVAGRTREIWLIGQNVNSYQPDFPDLLRACASFDGDYRLRFMTSHPRDAGQRLFTVMASSPRIAPNLHLPAQSGSDAVLKRMNRGYTREEFLSKIRQAKEIIPGLTLTSDVIVGFPGETERDFSETLALLQEVRFAKLFTFQYSARSGTPAAELESLPKGIVKERFMRLLECQKRIEEDNV